MDDLNDTTPLPNQSNAPSEAHPLTPLQPTETSLPIPQSPEASPNLTPAKPRRASIVLASIAFALIELALFSIGPGVLILAKIFEPYSWIVHYFYPFLFAGASIASIISTILYIISCTKALKKQPKYVVNILIMMIWNVLGLAAMWLFANSIIQITVLTSVIIMSVCAVLPFFGLLVLHFSRKRGKSPSESSPLLKVLTCIALLALIIESGVAISYFAKFWSFYYGSTTGIMQQY